MPEEEKVDAVEQIDTSQAEDTADVSETSAEKPSDAEVKDSTAAENIDTTAAESSAPSNAQLSDDDLPVDEVSSVTEEVVPPLPDFTGMLADAAANSIDLLNDVQLNVKIELGRAEMTVEEILRLSEGVVVELDKLAGDPVDVLVNEQLVARGEVLVVNDNFCVRINEIIPGVSEQVGQPVVNH